MRHFLIAGGTALACLCGIAAYADDISIAEPSSQTSLVAEPGSFDCGCDCSQECYDCCDCFNGRQRILGLLPSDHCFDDFVSPLSNPFFFEDPRSLTEVRGMFIDNVLPTNIGGGDVHVWAAQLRGRVTDRVSLIAPRLGYLSVNQGGGGAPQGFMSAPLGFKYNFLRDVDAQLLATVGMTYFVKGSGIAGGNFGDGDFHFFLTGGKEIFDRGHWLSGTGFRIPASADFGTQMWYWSNQWDYQVVDRWYVLGGVNWFHYMRSSPIGFSAPVSGLDFINLPVNGVAGNNVVSALAGLKFKPSPHCELGAGFEFPLTDRTDILKNRVYADVIFRY